ncbi:MAG: phenylalanine--tRNA ligase subunit beta [Actinobacteria bacterium]|nr:phenylalanine--tRNA ligase subunit beta [Actinomycetota bacterium]
MKVTINWIEEFLEIGDEKLDAEEVSRLLTMSGTEVKKIEDIGSRFNNIVVGQIIDFKKHPDADKLAVCQVDTGNAVLNIVCGARNFSAGDKVAVALEGARTVQGLTISKSKLRGIISEGMLCSEYELGLSDESKGIMILSKNCTVGRNFAASLGLDDTVLELEITPNRPDCLNIMGIAREISALKKIPFKPLRYDLISELNPDSNFEIDIRDFILCPRYSAKIFADIPKTESPEWLKNKLILCDYRPVDLVVDLTNYVMHEVGQPLHAFDRDLLFSEKIIIRTAQSREQIRSIDDSLRNLGSGMLVIADEKKPVAIAGIMGGKDTEISHSTRNVLLESANFYGPSIMRTSAALGLRSEASNRFEKKIDPEITVIAIKRFEELLTAVTKRQFKPGIYDSYKKTRRTRQLTLRPERVASLLGKDIGNKDIMGILSGLGIQCAISHENKTIIEATVPSSRFEDLEREIDLIEEIARIYGFENFDSRAPLALMRKGCYSPGQDALKTLRKLLCGIGFDEVINYSFISQSLSESFFLSREENYKNPVKILNPINEDFAYLRTSPLPLMVKNAINNLNHDINEISIFEITKIYSNRKDSVLPDETTVLGVLVSGKAEVKSWESLERQNDFYDIKGVLEYLFSHFYRDSRLEIIQKKLSFFHPVISGEIMINEIAMGIIGKISPIILDSLDITQDIHYLELDLDKFIKNIKYPMEFRAIAQFPSIDIDLALVIDENIKHSEIEAEIRNNGTGLLKTVRLFDIYRGPQVGECKKSMAYSLTFQEQTRTLKDTEVEVVVKRILENLAKKFGARLRD